MIVALLHAILLRRLKRRSVKRLNPTVNVDRIELNHYWWATGCESHQVILWRWSHEEGRYLADRFFFIADDGSDVPRRVESGKWRFTYHELQQPRSVRSFETDDLIETVTAFDPWKRAKEVRRHVGGR